MIPRRMEIASRPAGERLPSLADLLPEGVGRLGAIAWNGAGAVADEIVRGTRPEVLGGGVYDAVGWEVEGDVPDTAAFEGLRHQLSERGRLVIQLAGGDDAGRRLVRRLSESGFVVLEELEAGGRRLVSARRDAYRIRSFADDGDLEAIERLFTESFHVERNVAHWRWKYHENPWANRAISLAVAPSGALATHYAGYAMPFWCDGRAVLGLQMGDTMTAAEHRQVGRGTSSLLARTVKHFFAVHRHSDFGFFYGFNRGAIRRFSQWFIGGSAVEPVRLRRREISVPPAWSSRGYRIERLERAGTALDRFFRRVAPRYGFLVQRDARYVDWRYLRCPDLHFVVLSAWRLGRLVGWAVFRRQEDLLLWGDLLVDPRRPRATEALLAAALAEPGLAGARAIEGWFSDRPAFVDSELRRLGFEVLPHPQKLDFMILPDTEADPPLERLYYTMGDGDLF